MMVTSSGTPLGFVRAEYWVERGRRVDAKMNMLQELVGEEPANRSMSNGLKREVGEIG